LKIIRKESNPPYGGLLGLIGREKQRVILDRVRCQRGTDKNRKSRESSCRVEEYFTVKLLILVVLL
jgi:hypothetical protein